MSKKKNTALNVKKTKKEKENKIQIRIKDIWQKESHNGNIKYRMMFNK